MTEEIKKDSLSWRDYLFFIGLNGINIFAGISILLVLAALFGVPVGIFFLYSLMITVSFFILLIFTKPKN